MKNYIISIKKKPFHLIYLFLRYGIDLSEIVHNKLNYIKLNHKSMLISIFEESDESINNKLVDNRKENQQLNAITTWLGSLFGKVEEEILIHKQESTKSTFFVSNIELLTKPQYINNVVFASVISLMFLIYYYFT